MTEFSVKIVVLVIVTQSVVYVTASVVQERGKIQVSGEEPQYILKTGAWYEYQGEKIGQGREKAAGWLRDRPDVVATLTAQLRTHYLQAALPAAAATEDTPPDDDAWQSAPEAV
jgi:recombination protein RecA